MPLFGTPNPDQLYNRRDVPGLIKLLDYKRNVYVQQKAAQLLGQLKDPRAIEPLMAVVRGRSPIRLDALRALSEMDDPRLFPFFCEMLFSEYDFAAIAIDVLKRFGDQAVGPLVEFVARKKYIDALCCWAIWALEELGWEPDQSKVAVLYWIVYRRWDKCLEMGSLAVEHLIDCAYQNQGYRDGAIKTLGAMKDPRAVEYLISHSGDIVGCLEALGENPDPDPAVIDHLISYCRNGYYDWRVFSTLRKIGAPAVPALIAMATPGLQITNPDSLELTSAKDIVCLLGQIGDKRAAEFVLQAMFRNQYYKWAHEVENFGPLFEDYLPYVMQAVQGYQSHETVEYIPGTSGSSGDALYTYEYDLQGLCDGVERLYQLGTPLATNLLHLITNRNDMIELMQKGSLPGRGGVIIEPLDFSLQRTAAQDALERLGHPPYQPGEYLKKEAWKIA